MPDPTANSAATQQASGDAFFILKDCRELFQRRLVEIARQSGLTSPPVIEAFSREVGEAHDELAASAQQDGFEQTAGLTASRISLVGHDDLELEIRIGEIAHRLRGDERINHWRVQLRYMTLLNRPKMARESNPLGLDPIARGLWAICRAGDGLLDRKLDRLERLEEMLSLKLPDVYLELNTLLESHHVEPAHVRAIQRGSGGVPEPGAGSSASGTGGSGHSSGGQGGSNALSALQDSLRQQFGGDDLLPAGFAASNPAGGGGGNFTINASTLVMLTHLMERLSVLEQQQLSNLSSASPGNDAGQAPLRALKSKDLDLPLGKPAAIALDTLSLIFDGIFAAPDLPDVVKAAIGRLQIPLLKLAILDETFFGNTQHPGRQLVNRMARAAIGLGPDTRREHPVCVRLGQLANAVRMTLEKNDGNLSPHLDELESLIATRDQATQAGAKPYIELVLAYEAGEVSRVNAQSWLDKALSKTTDAPIARFLSDYWLRVMQAAWRDGGSEGPRWKESVTAIDELLWSVQPKLIPEDRKQLLALIPSLIKRLNVGLDTLSVSAEERKPFLDACFDLQTAAFRGRPDAPDAAQNAEPAPTSLDPGSLHNAVTPHTVHLLEEQGKLVQYLGQPSATPSPWRTGGSAWKEGDWISFRLPDGEHLCGRHCMKATPSGTVLLYNAEWGYAVALAPIFLEQQLRNSQARIASDQSLFDDAAERALGQIKPA